MGVQRKKPFPGPVFVQTVVKLQNNDYFFKFAKIAVVLSPQGREAPATT